MICLIIKRGKWIKTMKILVLSDIHSNIYALEAIWKREKREDVLLCAGDLVDYGTTPKEIIAWMREHDVLSVRGNHDQHLVNIYRQDVCRHTQPNEWKWVHDNCLKLDETDVKYLAALPEVLDMNFDGIRYTMRHMYRDYEQIETLTALDDYLREIDVPASPPGEEHRLIFGHTHRRCVHYLADNRLWINPGSASYRRPGDPDKSAHYAVIQDGRIHLRSVPYDRQPLLRETEAYARRRAMMVTELQDAFFYFGNARTKRDPVE